MCLDRVTYCQGNVPSILPSPSLLSRSINMCFFQYSPRQVLQRLMSELIIHNLLRSHWLEMSENSSRGADWREKWAWSSLLLYDCRYTVVGVQLEDHVCIICVWKPVAAWYECCCTYGGGLWRTKKKRCSEPINSSTILIHLGPTIMKMEMSINNVVPKTLAKTLPTVQEAEH